jgi:hypothetical protein
MGAKNLAVLNDINIIYVQCLLLAIRWSYDPNSIRDEISLLQNPSLFNN